MLTVGSAFDLVLFDFEHIPLELLDGDPQTLRFPRLTLQQR